MNDYVRITDRKIELTDEGVEALMSGYTPTTEEVRTGYSTATYDDDKAGEEFDRWLAEVKAQAWEEGYNAKWVETYFYDNPYRKGYKNILQSPPLFPEHVGEGE
jgi:hypothetical protein